MKINYNLFQVQDTLPQTNIEIQAISPTPVDGGLNIERNTIELVTLRTFANDSTLVKPKKYTPLVKIIPFLPENDTIEHPTFNIFDANFTFPEEPAFFDQFYFTPFDPELKNNWVAKKIKKKTAPELSFKKIISIEPESKNNSTKILTDSSVGFGTTDWMLGVIFLSLLIFAWLRVGFSRYFQNVIQASYNYFTARRIYEEGNITRSRVFYFMNLLFVINLSLFLSQYIEYNHIYLFGLHGILQFLFCFALIVVIYSLKSFVFNLLDFLFLLKNSFSSYVFTVFLYNKIVGFLLLPIVTILPFVPSHVTRWLFLAGGIIILSLYIIRVFKGLQLCFKNRLSIFYLILYLCALEILPMLILFKLVLSYL